MKKFLTLAAVLVIGFSANKAKAQNQVTVTVNLAASQTLVVNNAAVGVTIASPAEYAAGNHTTVPNQLTVTASGGFTVSVATSGNLVGLGAISASSIPAAALEISRTQVTGTSLTAGSYNTAVSPTTTPAPFFSYTGGTLEAQFDIDYKIIPGAASVNLLNKPVGAYVSTLTYTIAAS